MLFAKALKLIKEGYKIKLPSWDGYWCWENETIIMHCKDGTVLDIRQTETVDYTFTNVASDEWILATVDNTPVLGGEALFGFNEAIKYVKRGLKVARKGWNGKDMWIALFEPTSLVVLTKEGSVCEKEYTIDTDKVFPIQPAVYMKTAEGNFIPWLASQSDLLSDDWVIVD
jgi:hypothetical protein